MTTKKPSKPSQYDWQAREITDWNTNTFLAFIAHAREDIPQLVAEVERLRNEIETIHAELDSHTNQFYHEKVRMVCTWILEDSQKRLGGDFE